MPTMAPRGCSAFGPQTPILKPEFRARRRSSCVNVQLAYSSVRAHSLRGLLFNSTEAVVLEEVRAWLDRVEQQIYLMAAS